MDNAFSPSETCQSNGLVERRYLISSLTSRRKKLPIVTTVAKTFQEVTGEQPVFSGRMGAADTRFLIRHGDTPTVIFGPGVTAQMHATNEWLPLENLVIATKTLALAIHDWCA